MRFSGAAFGMVLLAGLAFYQDRVELTPGDEDLMSGTALAESAEIPGDDCESTAALEGGEMEACAEK